ncbi:serine/threonine-protein phosphatase 4 regulatory subunit-like protein, partial [Thalictrum thalictroides]
LVMEIASLENSQPPDIASNDVGHHIVDVEPQHSNHGGGEMKCEVTEEELGGILEVIAATGKFWHEWDTLKGLLSTRLKQVLAEYPEAQLDQDQQSSSLGETYADVARRLEEALFSFMEGPPFTLQRLCEPDAINRGTTKINNTSKEDKDTGNATVTTTMGVVMSREPTDVDTSVPNKAALEASTIKARLSELEANRQSMLKARESNKSPTKGKKTQQKGIDKGLSPPHTKARKGAKDGIEQILLTARSIYPKLPKLALALEKNLLVSSTLTISMDPYPSSTIPTSVEPDKVSVETVSHSSPHQNGVESVVEDEDEEMADAEEVTVDNKIEDKEIAEETNNAPVEASSDQNIDSEPSGESTPSTEPLETSS